LLGVAFCNVRLITFVNYARLRTVISDFFLAFFVTKLPPPSGHAFYAMVDRSSDAPFHDARCAGEVCFSRSMEAAFVDYGVDDGGRFRPFPGQSGL
jgi:hypothetical protein